MGEKLYVRGTTVDAARRFAEQQKGTPGWDAFMSQVSPEQRHILEEPVKRRHWYDLELYASLIDLAAQNLRPDDQDGFLTDLGRFVVDDGVTSLYKAFFFIASPSFVIRGSALLWGMFFKGSKLKILDSARKRVTPAITNASFCSRALCVSIAGGMISSLTHAGAKQLELTHHRCRSEGGDLCEFRFRWK